MKRLWIVYVILFGLLFASSAVYADTPRALRSTYEMFFSGTGYELPYWYWEKQTLTRYEGSADNYILRTTPINHPLGDTTTDIRSVSQWQTSQLNQYPGTSWYSVYVTGFPSFTEIGGYRGQCVAFAKAMTQRTVLTANWRAGEYVIPQVSQWYTSDISREHAGKMVAFFGNNVATGTQYPQGGTTFGHVGIFIRYAYLTEQLPTYPYRRYQIIGFWIADQNYEGTGYSNNPDGKIRYHLLRINPIRNASGVASSHTYAGQYRFVNIGGGGFRSALVERGLLNSENNQIKVFASPPEITIL